MNLLTAFAAFVFIIFVALLLFVVNRWLKAGNLLSLRPLSAYKALRQQVGLSVESGQQLHATLGQGRLTSEANPISLAALTVAEHLAIEGCHNGTPPIITVGEGTLLPAAQDSMRHAFELAGRPEEFGPGMARFLADSTSPLAYAAGVNNLIHQENAGSNLMLGRLGAEIAIMGEAAARRSTDQIVGTDNPVALGVAAALTDHVLVGEEFLAAGAYLNGQPAQIASLRVQDILRFFVAIAIIIAALWGIFV